MNSQLYRCALMCGIVLGSGCASKPPAPPRCDLATATPINSQKPASPGKASTEHVSAEKPSDASEGQSLREGPSQ